MAYYYQASTDNDFVPNWALAFVCFSFFFLAYIFSGYVC